MAIPYMRKTIWRAKDKALTIIMKKTHYVFTLSTTASQYLQTPTLDYQKTWGRIKTLEKNLQKLDNFEYVFRVSSLFTFQVQELIPTKDINKQTSMPLPRISKETEKHDVLCQGEMA
ncbi:hypothetical protein WA026_001651 [Henosepilachna vigintioctopunctata]|uniref:Uncharacterized protein n=1 Tax=Henosepilachna vigintioctopunctata TaxID=420089 RepID=A0AAW1UU29_9CUCU